MIKADFKKIFFRNLIYFFILVIYVKFLEIHGVTCPFKMIFKIPCPTCGVTRALLALLRGDIASYMKFNPMALPLFVSVAVMLNSDVFKKPKGVIVLSIITVSVSLVIYILRFITGTAV